MGGWSLNVVSLQKAKAPFAFEGYQIIANCTSVMGHQSRRPRSSQPSIRQLGFAA
jgi:hypothetical protein